MDAIEEGRGERGTFDGSPPQKRKNSKKLPKISLLLTSRLQGGAFRGHQRDHDTRLLHQEERRDAAGVPVSNSLFFFSFFSFFVLLCFVSTVSLSHFPSLFSSLSLSPLQHIQTKLYQALRRTGIRRRHLLLLVRDHARHRRGLPWRHRRHSLAQHPRAGWRARLPAGEGRREGAGVLAAGFDVAGGGRKGARGAGKDKNSFCWVFVFDVRKRKERKIPKKKTFVLSKLTLLSPPFLSSSYLHRNRV